MASTTAERAGTTTWQLDPTHSSVEFSVKHMMMTTVRGRFKELKATLTGDRDHPDEAGVVGSVQTETYGTPASRNRPSAPVSFAICINEWIPSCMRAPPEAAQITSGNRRAHACSMRRVTFSPTAEPMLPPRK